MSIKPPSISCAALAGSAFAPAPAATPDNTLGCNVGVVSDYRF